MTLSIFGRAIDSINEEDLLELINWPETESVEFKETLSGRDGNDPWRDRRDLTSHARDRLFKEVVAFANAQGGHVFLGFSETDDDPRRSKGIAPLPDCADLANRLEQSASSAIDPPIPGLLIRGIPTNVDGSGVVILRVPQSYAAPHRAPDKECYVRRGSHSQSMSMRDIQDMTLRLARRVDRIEATFVKQSSAFHKWFQHRGHQYVYGLGFRLTAVPVSAELFVSRVYRNYAVRSNRRSFNCVSDGESFPVSAVHFPTSDRPTIRGTVWSSNDAGTDVNHAIYMDGLQEITYRRGLPADTKDVNFYLGWILGHAINLFESVNLFRSAAMAPECEYGVELELLATAMSSHISLPLLTLGPHSFPLGRPVETPAVFPRLSFKGSTSTSDIISVLYRDLHDACGAAYDQPPALEVVES